MAELRVLYLEDEPLLGRIVKESLESRDCAIDWYLNGAAATAALERAADYDIAVLDVQLPGDDGFTIGRALRERHPRLPILYLTARVQAKDALEGFAAGGNDYVRKPFSMEELLIRMRNLVALHRSTDPAPASAPPGSGAPADHDRYPVGDSCFVYRTLTLERPDGTSVALSHREAELLRYLLRHRHRDVIERREILLELWHDDGFFNSRNLDVYVRKLRTHLAADPRVRIVTLRGVGYRLVVAADGD